jgi:hypothetical protein
MRLRSIHVRDIRCLLRRSESLELSKGAVLRLKWFLYARTHRGNVSLTCRHFGIARSTFLRWAARFTSTDLSSLEDHSRQPHRVREPETDPSTVELIRSMRIVEPLIGKVQIQKVLKTTHGIRISSSTIGRIISRYRLFFADTPSHKRKRLQDEAEAVTTRQFLPLADLDSVPAVPMPDVTLLFSQDIQS